MKSNGKSLIHTKQTIIGSYALVVARCGWGVGGFIERIVYKTNNTRWIKLVMVCSDFIYYLWWFGV